MLTYNLVYTGPVALTDLVSATQRVSQLRSTLSCWVHTWSSAAIRDVHINLPSHLVYLLEYDYTETDLGFDQLEGTDRQRVAALTDMLEQTKTACYLCTMEKKVYGGMADLEDYDGYYPPAADNDDHHDIDDVYDEELCFTHMIELDGTLIASYINIKMKDLVQPNPFEGRDPNEEESEPAIYYHRDAATTHWYR